MTTSPSTAAPSSSPSNGESPASLPRWRSFLSYSCHTARHLGATLNWRPVHEIEARTRRIEERTKQIENEILLVRSDRERIENDILQSENETEQLRRENARLAKLNARDDALSALIKQHCFPPESNSTPAQSTAQDSKPSLP